MNFSEDLKAYLDGELPLSRMEEVRVAVEKDPALARELDELRAVSAAIKKFAPAREAVGLESTLAALAPRRANPVRFWAPLGLATAVAAVGALVFLVGPSRSSDDGAASTVAMASENATAPSFAGKVLHAAERKTAPTSVAKATASSNSPTKSVAEPKPASPRVADGIAARMSMSTPVAATSPPVPIHKSGLPVSATARRAKSVPAMVPPPVPIAGATAEDAASAAPVPSLATPSTMVVEVESIAEAEARLRSAGIEFSESHATSTAANGSALMTEVAIDVAEDRVADLRAALSSPPLAHPEPKAMDVGGNGQGGGRSSQADAAPRNSNNMAYGARGVGGGGFASGGFGGGGAFGQGASGASGPQSQGRGFGLAAAKRPGASRQGGAGFRNDSAPQNTQNFQNRTRNVADQANSANGRGAQAPPQLSFRASSGAERNSPKAGASQSPVINNGVNTENGAETSKAPARHDAPLKRVILRVRTQPATGKLNP